MHRLREIRRERPLTTSDFERGVYAAREMKDLLWRLQYAKCCYCEREYERRYSDVEHFRPKAEAVRARGKVDEGYWWLAYDFDNLYFACPACNRPKSTRFPLLEGSDPLRPEEHPRTRDEGALLLDPGVDAVEDHLTFVWIDGQGYRIAPRDQSDRGRTTILVLGLDRDDLVELRAKYYKAFVEPALRRYADAERRADAAAINEARREAASLAAAKQPHALLARTAFRDAGLL